MNQIAQNNESVGIAGDTNLLETLERSAILITWHWNTKSLKHLGLPEVEISH